MSTEVTNILGSANQALEDTSKQAGTKSGWEFVVDIPESSVEGGAEGPWQVMAGLLAGLAGVATIIMLFVLVGILKKNYAHEHAVVVVLSGGTVLGVLALSGVAWRALTQARPTSHLHLELRTRAAADTPINVAPAQAAAAKAGAPDTPVSSGGSAAASEKGLLAKEPVIAGTLLFAAGTLAVGLTVKLSGEEIAAIAAGASAIIGLFVRQSVTPLAQPKNSVGDPLTPS